MFPLFPQQNKIASQYKASHTHTHAHTHTHRWVCVALTGPFCWMEIPDQNMIMNLNILAATIRSFKMLIYYTLDMTPHSPLAPYPSLKRKRRQRNCFKIPTSTGIVVIIANTPSKFFRLHLGTNFLSFDWDLLAFSFSNLFLFSFPPPPLPPMLLLRSSHQSWVRAVLAMSKES